MGLNENAVSDILSQAEIEALLTSLAEQPPPPPSGPGPGSSFAQSRKAQSGAVAYEVYDFRRPDKFSKEQLRTLQMLHETFGRHAATGLSAYLRSPVSIDLISLEQIPYEDYIRGITNSVFTVMSLPPLTGQAVLEMEFPLILGMVDRLLGGPGKGVVRSVLTDIERPLVRQMVERMFSALKTAWEGIVFVNPGIEQTETASQFVQIAPPGDVVVAILFEVKVGTNRGAMSICIPYTLMKPITAKLSAQKWFVNSNRKPSNTHRKALSDLIQQTKVDVAVHLGSTRLNVRKFLALQPGDVLTLGTRVEEDVVLHVGKRPKFLGKPGTSGKRLAFTIHDTISPE